MRGMSLRFVMSLPLLALLGCQTGGAAIPEGSGPDHDTYYTRFAIVIDRNLCRSTNYRITGSGLTIPINTKLQFVSKRRHRYTMRMDDGREFMFEHVKKHTLNTPAEAFDAFFSATPTDLGAFTAKEREAIQKGLAQVGMSKQAVLAAIGPPPAVGTLNRDALVWKYWKNRFATFTIEFDDRGKVTRIAN